MIALAVPAKLARPLDAPVRVAAVITLAVSCAIAPPVLLIVTMCAPSLIAPVRFSVATASRTVRSPPAVNGPKVMIALPVPAKLAPPLDAPVKVAAVITLEAFCVIAPVAVSVVVVPDFRPPDAASAMLCEEPVVVRPSAPVPASTRPLTLSDRLSLSAKPPAPVFVKAPRLVIVLPTLVRVAPPVDEPARVTAVSAAPEASTTRPLLMVKVPPEPSALERVNVPAEPRSLIV